MKIKSSLTGLVLATSVVALVIPGQAAWAMHKHCSGKGWHMVSVKCNIKPAENWQDYNSGVYTKPLTGKNMLLK